jgi:ribose transport system ATP-binding protein
LVLQAGQVKAQLSGDEASRENLVAAFFAKTDQIGNKKASSKGDRHLPGWLIPLIALVAVLLTTGLYNPRALSPFGLGLLLSTALPLVLVSLGQMFVVGRSEIDLGVGAFAGPINVISATLLVENPVLGIGALAVVVAAYGLLGWLIHARQIPAIVATLGSAFIWTGLGYVLQPAPGGSSPPWLTSLFNLPIPFLPIPIWMLLVASVTAIIVTRSRLGVVQRGFGNNGSAMRQLGWPAARSHVVTYLLSAVFGLAAGLCLTGVNTASDINAASSYTLLSVAAVVMGGCELVGGRIEPLGVVFAAVTLSLLGTLLGFMRLSSDNIAAVQGSILIVAVLLRTAWKKPL